MLAFTLLIADGWKLASDQIGEEMGGGPTAGSKALTVETPYW